MLTWPDVFFTNEEIMPIVVDFPDPFGPRIPNVLFSSKQKLILSIAGI